MRLVRYQLDIINESNEWSGAIEIYYFISKGVTYVVQYSFETDADISFEDYVKKELGVEELIVLDDANIWTTDREYTF
jgi:hypothetical protein